MASKNTTRATSRKPAKPAAAVKPAATAAATTRRKPATRNKPAAKAANPVKSITLTYVAPEAVKVMVVGDFTGWENAPVSYTRESGGVWKTTLSLKPGRYEYRLLVDGQWQNDPECAELQPNEFGSANCVLSVVA